jgi:hypothetical protein
MREKSQNAPVTVTIPGSESNIRPLKYRVLEKELYNVESLYKFMQRTRTMLLTALM